MNNNISFGKAIREKRYHNSVIRQNSWARVFQYDNNPNAHYHKLYSSVCINRQCKDFGNTNLSSVAIFVTDILVEYIPNKMFSTIL